MGEPIDRSPGTPNSPTGPNPATMRSALESARRRLADDDQFDDLPQTAAELRAVLRDTMRPPTNSADDEIAAPTIDTL